MVFLMSRNVSKHILLALVSLYSHGRQKGKICFLKTQEVSVTDVIYVGKTMQRVVPQKLAAHLPYRYT